MAEAPTERRDAGVRLPMFLSGGEDGVAAHRPLEPDGAGCAGQLGVVHGDVSFSHEGEKLGAARPQESLGHGHQERVTGVVAEGVVHQLEPRQIDEEDRHRRWLALSAGQGQTQMVEEATPTPRARAAVIIS
jgi:hypothetical protein